MPFSRGSNSGLPHCGWILYHLSHQGSPKILEWVAYPFSKNFPTQESNRGLLHCRWILYQLKIPYKGHYITMIYYYILLYILLHYITTIYYYILLYILLHYITTIYYYILLYILLHYITTIYYYIYHCNNRRRMDSNFSVTITLKPLCS